MPTNLEQEQDLEQEPLLDELGDRIPEVYPLIHAIRTVRNFTYLLIYFQLLTFNYLQDMMVTAQLLKFNYCIIYLLALDYLFITALHR